MPIIDGFHLHSQPDKSVQGPPGPAGPEGPRGPAGEDGRDGRDVSVCLFLLTVQTLVSGM